MHMLLLLAVELLQHRRAHGQMPSPKLHQHRSRQTIPFSQGCAYKLGHAGRYTTHLLLTIAEWK